jgi:hypothetical protein
MGFIDRSSVFQKMMQTQVVVYDWVHAIIVLAKFSVRPDSFSSTVRIV